MTPSVSKIDTPYVKNINSKICLILREYVLLISSKTFFIKKILLSTTMLLSVLFSYSQSFEVDGKIIPYSLKITDDKVKITDDITLKKGDKILVFIPYNNQKDFLSIEKKEGLLSVKNLSKVADVVSTGALAVGLGTNNFETMVGSLDVFRKTQSVSYGLDALNKINELPISKNAKKIAGKYFEIEKIESDGADNIFLEGTIEKKKYTINLKQALYSGEIKIDNIY